MTVSLARRRERGRAAGLVWLLLLWLGGCADLDPAYSPLEWGRSIRHHVVQAFEEGPATPLPPRVEAPPAEGRPYPNLAAVPRPPSMPAADARLSEAQALAASRNASIISDQVLRSENLSPSLPEAPRPRSAAVAAAPPRATDAPAAAPEPGQASRQGRSQVQAQAPRAAPASSVFMGSVVMRGNRGDLADFQRKVLEDAAAMARQSNGRIRLVGGAETDRDRVVRALAALGLPLARITTETPREGAPPPRPAVEIFVDY